MTLTELLEKKGYSIYKLSKRTEKFRSVETIESGNFIFIYQRGKDVLVEYNGKRSYTKHTVLP